MEFPKQIFEALRDGKICRAFFISLLTTWQKQQGQDFTCHGYADSTGVYVVYRGEIAKVDYKFLIFQNEKIPSFFAFCRRVDSMKRLNDIRR